MVNTTPSGGVSGGYKGLWPFKGTEALEELEKRVRRLEDDFKRLELDAEDLHDRCKRMLGRVVKERARIEEHAGDGDGADTSASDGTLPSPHTSTTLSAHQKQIQQQILRRRMGAL